MFRRLVILCSLLTFLSCTSTISAQITEASLGYKLLATPSASAEQLPIVSFRVTDGDTVRFTLLNGEEIKTRLLLIDTPELNHPDMGKQLFADEATARVVEILENANSIKLEYDSGPQYDKYENHLVYVWVDNILLQEILVTEGLARVHYVMEPNTRYLSALNDSQEYAKQQGLLIWSGATVFEDDLVDSSATTQPVGFTSSPQPATSTEPEPYYKNCKEVKAAGKAPIYPGDPGFRPQFDRDNDGIGCE